MLTANSLLAGANVRQEVEIPERLVAVMNGDRCVTLRPLTVRDLRLIARASKENEDLTAALMVRQALVEPTLTLEQLGQLPAGLMQFLLRAEPVERDHRKRGRNIRCAGGSVGPRLTNAVARTSLDTRGNRPTDSRRNNAACGCSSGPDLREQQRETHDGFRGGEGRAGPCPGDATPGGIADGASGPGGTCDILGELAPDLFAADPTRLLAALLATPVGEADQIRARRGVRSTLPARKPVPGSAHPPSTGRAALAVVGPAGIVAAARDALRQVRAIATEPAAAVMGSPAGRETITSATLGPLRDALRRSIAAPASQDPKPAASSDHGIAGVTDRIPSPVRDRWRDTAAEIPMPAEATDEQLSATAGDALRRRFVDTAPTSRSVHCRR